ncbi:regulator [Methylobacterium gnaphalii]|uniref:Cupin n=1 Tax=Methylobacterium gnaphalii TaxID=1010610 RepID=A0A512JRS0_9HYPH|nr:regulator [Methylobacterium gnaphalii]GEP12639.1 hypothetical protein MGN01_44840 [Methylobacterium gnaphalii]GJD71776.1 hypothetical protein MMMDOFMJ_4741 [Methylobacterium gnaphalii]GLS48927.1 hypothetical protein GCM10007885_17740 [Methylobacterium gnaphalii]
MTQFKFDDRYITWTKLDWLEHVEAFVYSADPARRTVDALFKFAPLQKAMLHRHKAPYTTFVVQGELRFYSADGTLREIRPAGSYVPGVLNGEPHLEGGGEEEAIVFFTHHSVEDALYEFLDGDMKPVISLRFDDARALLEAQGTPQWKRHPESVA